jgi:hypothetical protein
MGAQRKGQAVPLLSEEAYFSRLVPEDDKTSATGVPPPT